jgi:hypothetical protein
VKASYRARAVLSRRSAITLECFAVQARVDPLCAPAIFRRLRDTGLAADARCAPVAELVDALDSKSSSARSAGSIPARGTKEFVPIHHFIRIRMTRLAERASCNQILRAREPIPLIG